MSASEGFYRAGSLSAFSGGDRFCAAVNGKRVVVFKWAGSFMVPQVLPRGAWTPMMYAARQGATEAARILADLVGDDLGRLDNEMAKLALGSSSGAIGADEVGQFVAFQREREMWDLTNALGSGDAAEALRRWRQLVQLESSAEFRAVTWLGLWLENVRKATTMLRRGENAFAIGQALRIWQREQQQSFLKTVQAMGPAGLERAQSLLAEIDFQGKTGIGDAAANVERFILTLAAAGGGK